MEARPLNSLSLSPSLSLTHYHFSPSLIFFLLFIFNDSCLHKRDKKREKTRVIGGSGGGELLLLFSRPKEKGAAKQKREPLLFFFPRLALAFLSPSLSLSLHLLS